MIYMRQLSTDCDRHVDCRPTMSSVTGEKLDLRHCETIEEILRRVQFRTIDLEATHLDVEVSTGDDRHKCFSPSLPLLKQLHWLPGNYRITESNSNCPLLHIVLLQHINHLIWLVSYTFFLTSPDNSDHLPHSSFIFPELN